MSTRRSPIVCLVAAACLLPVGCTTPEPEPTPTSSTSSPAPTTQPAALVLPATSLVTFADFAGVPLLDPDTPAYPGPATPTSLAGVRVADPLADDIGRVGAALVAHGVAVDPAGSALPAFVYEANWYLGIPSYVTTDVAYHTWHLAFDKTLRELERTALLPTLEDLVTGLLVATAGQADELSGTPVAVDAERAEQLVQVAAALLELPVSLGPLAAQEVALIEAGQGGLVASPLLGSPVDYSMFTPRGHYTRSPELTRYFRAMTALGQLAFCLPGTGGCDDPAGTLRVGLLATRALADPTLTATWRRVYEPTAFLVGLSDDYTPGELADAADATEPGWSDDPAVLADDAVVAAIAEQLAGTREVRINPAFATVRLMGSRFVLDAFVLDQLIYPNVGTAEHPRELPSGLDVAAVLGSTLAAQAADAAGATGFANYTDQRAALTEAVAARPVEQWGATVYDAWLYALQPVLAEHGTAYPDYLRTPAWAAKSLQTGLASYTELKHDTILYAKQAMAEGGGEDQPLQQGTVEPQPVAFERLAAAADLLRRGLADRDLLAEDTDALLTSLGEYLTFLAGAARAELAGTPLTPADHLRISETGSELEMFVWLTSDLAADGSSPEADQDAALVADVATSDDTYLELGTARFDRLLVLVPTDDGGFQVASGAVNTYRELESAERLSDERWREVLDSGAAPTRPQWLDALYGE